MSTRKNLSFDRKELSKFTDAGEAVVRAALALEWSAQWQNPPHRVLTLRSARRAERHHQRPHHQPQCEASARHGGANHSLLRP
jgi:hypothetical protein